MNGLLEYKNFTADLKDVDIKSGTVTGWWANYGSKDYDKDIIVEHAAKKSIDERGPKGSNEIYFLNQHNFSQPHCKPYILESQEVGIYFEATPAPTSYSKDALILYDAGVVVQHSIGFQTIKDECVGNWGDADYFRYIKELKLYEGSNVTLGANPNTPFTGFKSLTIPQVNDQISIIMKLIRNGSLTDETFGQLEIALKQLQLQSYELGKKALEEKKPDDSTLKIIEPQIIDTIKSFTKNLTA